MLLVVIKCYPQRKADKNTRVKGKASDLELKTFHSRILSRQRTSSELFEK